MKHYELLQRLAQEEDSRIVLLVLDGVGDLVTADQPRTALDAAATPNLDSLAARSALGRIEPVAPGVTPGSGPGHLALFGYDPTAAESDIGRGVLEALGVGMEVAPGDVLARGNFASADAEGRLTDRRAGRPSNEENRRLVAQMQEALDREGTSAGSEADGGGVRVDLQSGEGHRFVLRLRGDGLSPEIDDTDPQETGVPPEPVRATAPAADDTARAVERAVERMHGAIADEEKANRVLLRGFSSLPDLPSMNDLYRLRCGAFAGYPLYRGVASVCGMEVVECGKELGEVLDAVEERWDDFDLFFLHVKQTDMAGEDGDLDAKIGYLESVDAQVPRLLDLGPDVIAVTGDHSTPAPMAGHSWHPVPLLLHARHCFVDDTFRYTETQATRGHLGTLPSMHLMGLMLANAGRLAKFGA